MDVMHLQITEKYYGITRGYVQEFVNSCPTCQITKPHTAKCAPKQTLEKDSVARAQVSIIGTVYCLLMLYAVVDVNKFLWRSYRKLKKTFLEL